MNLRVKNTSYRSHLELVDDIYNVDEENFQRDDFHYIGVIPNFRGKGFISDLLLRAIFS